MVIGDFLSQNARKHPEKRALSCEGKDYNYDQFNKEVNRLANGLLELGYKKGEKIAIVMKNSDHFAICYFAVAKIGLVVVPVNFRLTAPEMQYIFMQSDTKTVFCDDEFGEVVHRAHKNTNVRAVYTIGGSPVLGYVPYQTILLENDQDPAVEVRATDDLEILYTSGTTGRPKGALFDHQRVFNVGITVMIGMGLNSNDRFLHVAPLFHSAQLNLFFVTGIVLGASHVIHRDFEPTKILQAIEHNKITHFFGVPSMYNFLLQVANINDYDLSSVKRCGYGAAPMAPELVRKSMKMFATDQFYNLCGLTEAGPGGICLDPEGHKNHLGKGGKPFFLTETKVVDEEGNDVRPGIVGEFVIKGATVMKAYYKKPDETMKTIKNGWLYTGDLAVIDEEGYITLVDRKKDMIISGGENVYSIEVEEVMYEHPQVLEAATIGLPDEVWGEIVTAIVVPKAGEKLDEEKFKSFCRKKLAGYKIPRKIIFAEQLPRNASGKILKYQLRETYHIKEVE